MNNALSHHRTADRCGIEAATAKRPAKKGVHVALAYQNLSAEVSEAGKNSPASGRKKSAVKAAVPDTNDFTDASLISRLKRDLSDELALEALLARHWKPLFAQCRMLTSNPTEAFTLAEAVWKRVLQALPHFPANGDFPAYLVLTATDIWRNQIQSKSVEGPGTIAEIPPSGPQTIDNGIKITFTNKPIGDLSALSAKERANLGRDIDLALAGLTLLQRDAVLAHYLNGESPVEIGRRYRQSEQRVRGWLKTALQRIRNHFESQTGRTTGLANNGK